MFKIYILINYENRSQDGVTFGKGKVGEGRSTQESASVLLTSNC